MSVWVELGLQSADDSTLLRIGRGHTSAVWKDAAEREAVFTYVIADSTGDSGDVLRNLRTLGNDGDLRFPLLRIVCPEIVFPQKRHDVPAGLLADAGAVVDGAGHGGRRDPQLLRDAVDTDRSRFSRHASLRVADNLTPQMKKIQFFSSPPLLCMRKCTIIILRNIKRH